MFISSAINDSELIGSSCIFGCKKLWWESNLGKWGLYMQIQQWKVMKYLCYVM